MDRPPRSRFERAYSVVVLIKGVDGTVELLLGVLLAFVPSAVRSVLLAVAAELGEGASTIGSSLSADLEQVGDGLTGGVLPFALFLVVHGVVKLLTVYALLRRLLRWYPWAIGALLVLLVVQTVDAIVQPTVGAWVLAALDVAVLVLVVLEYGRLRRPARAAAARS